MQIARDFLLALSVVLISGSLLVAQDDEDPKATSAVEAHEHPIDVVMEPLILRVEVEGIVESTETAELLADTESWKTLEIKKVLPEGTRVEAGQPVIWFEDDEYQTKLKDSELALELSRLSLEQAEIELQMLQKTQAWDEELAERTLRVVKEDFRYFTQVDRPQREKAARFSVKMSEGSLENAQEELQQLEKMYKEDELTEESEEIVLKRARRAVESSEFSLESTQLRTSRTLDVDLPREAEQLADQLRRAELKDMLSKSERETNLKKKMIEFTKSAASLKKQEEELQKLVADGKRLVLRTPVAGILYYGKSQKGKWVSGTGGATRELKAGQSVTSSQVLATIVDPAAIQIRITLAEQNLQHVRAGVAGIALPTIAPDLGLACTVNEVSLIPVSGSSFEGTVSLTDDTGAVTLMPGMTAKVVLNAYVNDQAIVIPEELIDRKVPGHPVVHVLEAGKVTAKPVKLGPVVDGRREVVSGLKAGDQVMSSPGDRKDKE